MIETKYAKSVNELDGGDSVEHPDHYAGDGKIECMDAMRSMMSSDPATRHAQIAAYWWGCVFEYLWRWRRKSGLGKSGLEDLEKARQCLDYLIGEIEPKNGNPAPQRGN